MYIKIDNINKAISFVLLQLLNYIRFIDFF